MDQRLTEILDNRPSAIRNTIVIKIIQILAGLVVGLLLFVVVRLCKMLIKRNMFLLELDEWRYDWEESEKELESKNKI